MNQLSEPIDHARIDPDALKVVRRLARHGHEAYLVGGCVRDLLLGCAPKDFDVATSATPEEIRSLFRNSRIIGRRFRLGHIFFGPKIIETSTFRQNPRGDEEPDEENGESLLIRRDNVFGTAREDALRRDFTMNGLFYDPLARQVIDFVEGKPDLEARAIRTIGDPSIRFQEDPVRILRAIKFAARLDLTIEPETYAALVEHREKIRLCARARVLEEIYRLFREGASLRAMGLLEEASVLQVLLPELVPVMSQPDQRELLTSRLAALDTLASEQPLTNAVILAALTFGTVLSPDILIGGTNGTVPLDRALQDVLVQWTPSRRDRDRTRQILVAQRRLCPSSRRRRRRRPVALVGQDFFPESLTFYRLCCHTGEADPSTITKWEALHNEVVGARGAPGKKRGSSQRRRRPRGPRQRRDDGAGSGDDGKTR